MTHKHWNSLYYHHSEGQHISFDQVFTIPDVTLQIGTSWWCQIPVYWFSNANRLQSCPDFKARSSSHLPSATSIRLLRERPTASPWISKFKQLRSSLFVLWTAVERFKSIIQAGSVDLVHVVDWLSSEPYAALQSEVILSKCLALFETTRTPCFLPISATQKRSTFNSRDCNYTTIRLRHRTGAAFYQPTLRLF